MSLNSLELGTFDRSSLCLCSSLSLSRPFLRTTVTRISWTVTRISWHPYCPLLSRSPCSLIRPHMFFVCFMFTEGSFHLSLGAPRHSSAWVYMCGMCVRVSVLDSWQVHNTHCACVLGWVTRFGLTKFLRGCFFPPILFSSQPRRNAVRQNLVTETKPGHPP